MSSLPQDRSTSSKAPRRILVAEDNATNQEVIRRQLAVLGHVADMANDGQEALELWRKGGYRLLITDLHMPNMDGYQLAQAIRSEEARTGAARMPIMALTANTLTGEAERCKACGMDDYLSKPTRLTLLAEVLTKWLTSRVIPEQGKEVSGSSLFDPAMLATMVGDDPALHHRLLATFLDRARVQLADLAAACAASDSAQAGAITHGLKSAARAVGAMQMGDLCERIEQAAKAGDPVFQSMLPELQESFRTVRQAIDGWRGARPGA